MNWPWYAELLRFLERSGTPASWGETGVKDGGLISLDPSAEEMAREAVRIVAKILRGEAPATIPVYVSTRSRITVNLRTARAMKLTIPPSVLMRADQVVE
jgi:putative ABC transport system substrate-binding protein